MPDQPEPSTVESGPVTLVAADVPGATPMEQKKNLEESGVPVVSDPQTGVPVDLDSTTSPVVAPGDSGDQTPGDDDFVSLDELKKMSLDDLQRFISDNSLDAPVEAQGNSTDLLDWLLSEYGVDA